jgi:diguanylate cyclase (GGDEF)-like protein
VPLQGRAFSRARPGAVVTAFRLADPDEMAPEAQIQHDPLTGLPNRSLIIDLTREALGRLTRHTGLTALLAIDLDQFADTAVQLGDRSGDYSGDDVLLAVARRIDMSFRARSEDSRPTHTIGHVGGDRFLVMCDEVADAQSAEKVARRIAETLAAPMQCGGETLSLTAGIGIALTNDPESDPVSLIREAESAMRRAKQRGAGRQETFTGSVHEQRFRRTADEAALRTALELGEIRVAYQPTMSLATERMVAVEALLRWDNAARATVGLLDDTPHASKRGLSVPIALWVLGQACRDARSWQSTVRGGPLRVAMHLSPGQFETGLAATFRAVIESEGIEPSSVCLGITEKVAMQDAHRTIATLRELKTLGFHVSLDDFGGGFSSLAYLKRFPLDELRMDKSFIDEIALDSEASAIVAAVIAMAHALKLRVVAEGVENVHQVAHLRRHGCDEAQGVYFAPPGSAEEILVRSRADGSRATSDPPASPGPVEQTHATRVLIVDDVADVRRLARSSLTAAGMAVAEASSGEDALRLTRRFAPDCVLLDINLPGISGLEVCRIIRADHRNAHVAIVMLTGDAEASGKVTAFSLQADDYIVKPFRPRDLVNRVNDAIRRHADVRTAKSES